MVSREPSGSYLLSTFGTYTVRIRVSANERSDLIATVDGITAANENNYVDSVVVVGHEPCEEYSIPNLRTSCRSGYRQVDNSRYRWTRRVYRYRSGVVVSQYTETGPWQTTIPTLPGPIGVQAGNGTYRFQATLETEENFACVPEANCQGAPITELRQLNSGNYDVRFSVDIERTQAEQDALDRLEEIQQQQPAAPTPTEEAIQELAERIEENTQVAQDLLNQEKDEFTPTLRPVETTEDTKYRLITPLEYQYVDGKVVPAVRYESVRYLSPNNVASFVSRGYVVESVPPDTPVSSSKPYGKTLIERAQILTPPSITTRDIFSRTRKSGQQIIAEREGRQFTPTPLNNKKRRVIR